MQQRSEMVGTWTRRFAAVVAALLVSVLFVAARPAAASHYTNTTELGGTTNVTAAVAWSKAAFPTTATEALLGRDDLFADSLASGSMQASRPLLLTNSQTLSSEANAELNRLRPSVVNIMGGPSAVSTAVENDLKSKGYEVRRFSGPTRLETAIDIARRVLPTATTAVVAAAFAPQDSTDPTRAFADSIAAGGWAADRIMPVLLTESNQLSTATKNYLRSSVIRTVFVVGGTSAVSEAAVTELKQIGMTVRRISGPTRFDTAISIAKERGDADASDAGEVILTEGQAADSWAAGFSAAAYSAAKDAPIVLANGTSLPTPTQTWLSPTGEAAGTKLACAPRVSSEACDSASQAMGHIAITGGAPVLVSVLAGTAADGMTPISFKFSQPLAAAVTKGNFKIYTFDAQELLAASAARHATSADTVVAQFPTADVAEATVATVAHGAVTGEAGSAQNPEGAAALGTYTRLGADTRGPDLKSVTRVSGSDDVPETPIGEETPNKRWEMLFTFDEPVTGCGSGRNFTLVTSENRAAPADEEIVTYVVDAELQAGACLAEFDVPGALTLPEARRGYVRDQHVAGAEYQNPPASRAVSGGGVTDGPDLVGLTIDAALGQASFEFSQQVTAAVATGERDDHRGVTERKFKVYDSFGRVTEGTGANIDPLNNRRVLVTLENGAALRNVILGGAVETDAVTGPDPDNPAAITVSNGPAAIGRSVTFAAGRTSAPTLTGITRTGTSTTTVTFTFSDPVDRGDGSFAVYAEDGTRTMFAENECNVDASDQKKVNCSPGSATTPAVRAAIRGGVTKDAVRADGQNVGTQQTLSLGPEGGAAIA